jgi:hypothetical protein
MLLDDRALVWTNKTDGTIMSLDLASGVVRTLATGIAGPDDAAAMDATHVYWAGWRDGTVMRVPREGGEPEIVATIGETLPDGMALSATHVYWSVFDEEVHRAPLGGGAVEDLPPVPFFGEHRVSSSLLAAGDHLYVGSSSGLVQRLRIGPEEDAALRSTWETIASFAASEGPAIHAIEGGYVYGETSTALFRAPLAGGEPELLLTDMQSTDVAVANGWLYFATRGSVRRIPAGGGPVETIVHDPIAWSVAVGGGRVYWSSHEHVGSFEGMVRSVPEP